MKSTLFLVAASAAQSLAYSVEINAGSVKSAFERINIDGCSQEKFVGFASSASERMAIPKSSCDLVGYSESGHVVFTVAGIEGFTSSKYEPIEYFMKSFFITLTKAIQYSYKEGDMDFYTDLQEKVNGLLTEDVVRNFEQYALKIKNPQLSRVVDLLKNPNEMWSLVEAKMVAQNDAVLPPICVKEMAGQKDAQEAFGNENFPQPDKPAEYLLLRSIPHTPKVELRRDNRVSALPYHPRRYHTLPPPRAVAKTTVASTKYSLVKRQFTENLFIAIGTIVILAFFPLGLVLLTDFWVGLFAVTSAVEMTGRLINPKFQVFKGPENNNELLYWSSFLMSIGCYHATKFTVEFYRNTVFNPEAQRQLFESAQKTFQAIIHSGGV